MLVAVSELPQDELLRFAIDLPDRIKSPNGRTFLLPDFGKRSLRFRTMLDCGDIELYVHALNELRDKPLDLRKRRGQSVLVMMVVQPAPKTAD